MLTELLKPFPACSMDAYEVSSLVNKPQNDEPAYVLPLPAWEINRVRLAMCNRRAQ